MKHSFAKKVRTDENVWPDRNQFIKA